MTVLVFDIEADNLLPNLTKCHCLAIKEMTNDGISYTQMLEDTARLLRDSADSLEQTSSWLNNGIGYDCPALVQLYGDLADFTRPEIYDTLVASRFYHQEKRGPLYALGEELGFEKSSHDDFTTFVRTWRLTANETLRSPQRSSSSCGQARLHRLLRWSFGLLRSWQCKSSMVFDLTLTKLKLLKASFRQEQFDIERELQEHWEPKVIERYSEKTEND